MLNDTELRPALTPEEWAKRSYAWEYWADVHLHGDGDLTIHDANQTAIMRGREKHAMAALALHGEPFGFTREDVRFLRRMIEEIPRNESEADEWGGKLYSLAARIEALLPPE